MTKKFRTATQVDIACRTGHHTFLTLTVVIIFCGIFSKDPVYSNHPHKYDAWKVKLVKT
jgi:hypothetical protein